MTRRKRCCCEQLGIGSRVGWLKAITPAVLAAFILTTAAADTVHIVKKGETLDAISQAYGVSIDDLVSTNEIDEPNKIRAGQRIVIYADSGEKPQPLQTFLEISVPKKSTLSALARHYGIPLEAIAEMNGLKETYDIYEGQTLMIPIIVKPPEGETPPASVAIPSIEPATPPASPATEAFSQITVQKGDKLFDLAHQRGLTLSELAAINNLKPPHRIFVGQTLLVPEGASPLQAFDSTTVVVAKGESLALIAKRYGIDVRELANANQLKSPYVIHPGQRLRIPGAGDLLDPSLENFLPASVVVQKNESLSGIADRLGLSMRQLARFNGITDPNQIFAGQVIRIPGQHEDIFPDIAVAARAELDRIAIKSGKWKYIIVHHTATNGGTAKAFDNAHRRRGMENGLAYHFLIGDGRGLEDGRIYIGNRWKEQLDGGHLAKASLNKKAVGVCLVGNFERGVGPSPAQMESLTALTRYLMRRCDINVAAVNTHKGIHPGHTACPGRHFPEKDFLESLQSPLASTR